MMDDMETIELTHDAINKIVFALDKHKIFELDFDDYEEAAKTQTLINYLKSL